MAGAEELKIATSWGSIVLWINDGAVERCLLPVLPAEPPCPFLINCAGDDPFSRHACNLLLGKNSALPPIRISGGTLFQQQVWHGIEQIPFGQTRTYGGLAGDLGQPRSFRAVANACGKNPLPLFVPCHRVIPSGDGIGGFSSGHSWKALLLKNEGYSFI